ncbi:MAG TPA: EamA family transporter [Candidatus Sulfotelmatobacter sp.]|nr:EamA family transporter [Candidatus Sulfotelmatobacter sp.]
MGILLGLLTALSWGCSDFLARFSSRKIGSLRTTLYMQTIGLLLLTIALPRVGGWGHLFDGSGWQPWAWGLLTGSLNAFSTLCLYRSFEVGKLSVVAPLSASYPALTMAISFFTGERLTALRVVGIILILAGVAIVVRGEASATESLQEAPGAATSKTPGIGIALLSALGFGVLFWVLGNRAVPRVGYAATVWMIRLTSSVITALFLLVRRQPMGLPRDVKVNGWLLGMGVLDTGAFILNNLGMQLEQVSVVSVLSSLYGAVTVLLSAVILRERLQAVQWAGIAGIFVGIALISL